MFINVNICREVGGVELEVKKKFWVKDVFGCNVVIEEEFVVLKDVFKWVLNICFCFFLFFKYVVRRK